MVLKQMDASVCIWEVHNDRGESRTNSESQVREAQLQMAFRKGILKAVVREEAAECVISLCIILR